MGTRIQYLHVVALVLVCALSSAYGAQISELAREINLRGFVARITDAVAFSSPVSTAVFCFPAGHWEHAASFHCAAGHDAKRKNAKKLAYEQTTVKDQPDDVACAKVQLSEPASEMVCKLSTGLQIHANPPEIAQHESQLVEYEGTIQPISPYVVKSQSVVVQLASEKTESFSKPKGMSVSKSGSTLTCSGIKNTQPFSADPLHVHFKSNKPFLHILDLQRDITVSHWGRVYVTERYHVKHGGASVKGPFSRWNITESLHYDKRAYATPHIYTLSAYLHSHADQVTLKDDLGNIMSTSEQAHAGLKRVEFSPRYPLLGGWQTRFVLGYTLPLHACVTTDSRGRKEVTFAQSPIFEEDFFAESVTTRVIIPEGSSDVQVALGRLTGVITDDRTFTYLDTMIGRPTKVIQGGPMSAEEADAMVRVSYSFAPAFAALEPALLVGVFTALFMLWVGASRLDLTIVKGRDWQARQAQAKAHDVLRKARAAVVALDQKAAVVSSAAADVDSDASARLAGTVAALKSNVSKIETCLEELKQLGSTKAGEMAVLLDTYSKVVADAQKVQNSKGKDKTVLYSDFAATLAQAQVAKVAALAGV